MTGIKGMMPRWAYAWAAVAVTSPLVLAQGVASAPKPSIDQQLQAFSMEKAGPQGLTMDLDVVGESYGIEKYFIKKDQAKISELEYRIVEIQQRGGARADEQVAALQSLIETFTEHIQQLQKALASNNPCDKDVANKWRHMVEFARDGIQREQTLKAQAAHNVIDLTNKFQNRIDEFQADISAGEAQLARMDDECLRKTIAVVGSLDDDLGIANSNAKLAADAALATAANGQISDIPQISKKLEAVIATGRFNALAGYEETASEQFKSAIAVLSTFLTSFSANCDNQSADLGIVLSLARQAALTGIDANLTRCLYRVRAAGMNDQKNHQLLEFRNCSWDGTGTWNGRWMDSDQNLTGTIDLERRDDGISGPLSMSGTGGLTENYYPYHQTVDGKVMLKAEAPKNALGFEQRFASMYVQATFQAHAARARPFGPTVSVPAVPWVQGPFPVMILNGNKPCDPERDVWSYN